MKSYYIRDKGIVNRDSVGAVSAGARRSDSFYSTG
jgi:hypothetical protein